MKNTVRIDRAWGIALADQIIICETCHAADGMPEGGDFADQLRRLARGDPDLSKLEILTTPCLNVCSTPLAMALRGDAKDVYLFAGVTPQTDVADTMALLRLYALAPAGTITDARAAGRLRHCLIGRVPVL